MSLARSASCRGSSKQTHRLIRSTQCKCFCTAPSDALDVVGQTMSVSRRARVFYTEGPRRLRLIAFLDQDGTGYLQRNFRYICICSLGITKSALALDKFVGDLVTGFKINTVEPAKSFA